MKGFTVMRNKEKWKNIFEKNKYKLKPHENVSYGNLEVLILEVTPKDPTVNTNELEILYHYWSTWFNEMNIESRIHTSKNGIEQTKEILKQFLY